MFTTESPPAALSSAVRHPLQGRFRGLLLLQKPSPLSLRPSAPGFHKKSIPLLLQGKDSCMLISIYANAFGNGKEWTSPSGWSEYTSKGQTRADKLADCLFSAVKKHLPLMKMHTNWSDGDADLEESFYILKQTLYPAALTENCFMTMPNKNSSMSYPQISKPLSTCMWKALMSPCENRKSGAIFYTAPLYIFYCYYFLIIANISCILE